MQIAPPPARRARTRESVLPMINVVFLLLIFFLMTAQIEPAAPFPVDPPEAMKEAERTAERVLWVSAGGDLAFGDLRGEAALAALAEAEDAGEDAGQGVLLRVDAGLPAADLAALMARLGALGVTETAISATVADTMPGAAP